MVFFVDLMASFVAGGGGLRVCLGVERKSGAVCGRRMVVTSKVTSIPFQKYQGIGNDFILVDNRASTDPIITSEQSVKLCDRHFGVGADGE